MMSTLDDHNYNTGLRKAIEEIFIQRIVPGNFYILIHKYDLNVLTNLDIERIRLNLDKKINQENNMDILDVMTKYKGWFKCLLNVVKDPSLKQKDLVEVFQKLKDGYDALWNQQKRNAGIQEQGIDIENDEGNLATDGGPRKANNTVNNVTSTLENPSVNNNDGQCYFKNGKCRCVVCDIELTSEQHKNQHLAGQKHKKRAGQGFNNTQPTIPKNLDEPSIKDLKSDFVLSMRGEQNVTAVALSNTAADGGTVAAVDGSIAVGQPSIPSSDVNNITNTFEHLSFNNNDDQWSFENGKGRCNVCNIELTSEQHKNQHLVGRKHLKRAAQGSNKESSLSDIFGTSPQKVIASNETKPPPQSISQDLQRNKSFCEICKLALTSPEHASQHYSGKNHTKKVDQAEMLNLSQIFSGDQPGGSTSLQENGQGNDLGGCNVCFVIYTSLKNKEDHLNGKNHAKNMKKT